MPERDGGIGENQAIVTGFLTVVPHVGSYTGFTTFLDGVLSRGSFTGYSTTGFGFRHEVGSITGFGFHHGVRVPSRGSGSGTGFGFHERNRNLVREARELP
jgi:hypothetical protein